ncbi:MAG: aminotransferase class I/II-fold pyridoxal phosphate-dependent enzyme [Acidimicrobiales bacterium]|nr:aminotransferase [Acidimicrobiaceae bacterium]MDP6077362.1 aminotransferase class I/II-fold pyridoxal phosphate-dependent enzyme [Acidimicrobiales bacterium]HCV35544.1 aminotransferase [Acidimicrobiaceae bacterium]HJO79802.1 aminotransferase class I/II-fold pyridoxal phosphate-dependent enzyme [Acidimicrobiales bacterium]
MFEPSQSLVNPGFVDPLERRDSGVLKWNRYPDGVIPAWVAEHDLGPPPAVVTRLHELVDMRAFGYHTSADDVGPAFSHWTTQRHGWTPDPELILPTANVLQGIWACVEALTGPGDGIVYSPPVYPPFLDVAPTTNRRAVHWPMMRTKEGWRYNLDALGELLEADPGIGLLLLCHPHNPTGCVLTAKELERIVELAHVHDLTIVSDEIHSDLVYEGSTHIPMLTVPGAPSHTVTVTSGVKTFALGGMLCAVAVCGDERLHSAIRSIPVELLGVPNRMGCEASITAWETGSGWADNLLDLLSRNRRTLFDRIRAELPQVGMFLPESTFVAWLDLSEFKTGDHPARWLRHMTGIAGGNGPNFGPGGEKHVRITFGTSAELLDEITDRIITGLKGQEETA